MIILIINMIIIVAIIIGPTIDNERKFNFVRVFLQIVVLWFNYKQIKPASSRLQ